MLVLDVWGQAVDTANPFLAHEALFLLLLLVLSLFPYPLLFAHVVKEDFNPQISQS